MSTEFLTKRVLMVLEGSNIGFTLKINRNSYIRIPTSPEYQGSLGPPVCQNKGSFPKLRGPKI